jgi:predicted NUDIX family phosphoesterase|tara:strand:- start:431 stop:1060 length:630 start_codon:yes stop_codon:yes gene_type:complete
MLNHEMVKILVVKTEDLFKDHHFEGFMPIDEKDYIDYVLNNHYYEERNEDLENNPEHTQIIPYVWIINPLLKKVFIYQRSLGKDYQETRHINKYSGGVGGHVDEEEHGGDPIVHAMNRELKEELIMNEYPDAKFIGYINDDSDMYNKVHFAVVGLAETHEDVQPTDDGIKSGSFYSVEEIEQLFEDPNSEVETWTKLSWPHVKKHIQNL